MTDALAFVAVMANQPKLRADAVVVLSGDGEARVDMALNVFTEGGAPLIVLSGGLDAPPFSLTAQALARNAIEKGIAPDRLVLEADSGNTRQQAVNVVAMAMDRGWTKLLLVASHYHSFRAFLTFVRALRDAGQLETIRVMPATADHVSWFKLAPVGMSESRRSLLDSEFQKIEEYANDVATYAEGLAYLEFWEGR